MEAAHIVDEHRGGSDDEENGIPLCFDCHAEVGRYNDKHPKGNKYTPWELKRRRDRFYEFVESGALFRQIIAGQDQRAVVPAVPPTAPASSPHLSSEAAAVLKALLNGRSAAPKLRILSSLQRALVVDRLVVKAVRKSQAIQAIDEVFASRILGSEKEQVVLDRLVRRVTLKGDSSAKASLLRHLHVATLAKADKTLRQILFEDVFNIVRRDDYHEVNELVPALIRCQEAVPSKMRAAYVKVLLGQAESKSFAGAPAARAALRSLPKEVAAVGVNALDEKYLSSNFGRKSVGKFVRRYRGHAQGTQAKLLKDFVTLELRNFLDKHDPEENS